MIRKTLFPFLLILCVLFSIHFSYPDSSVSSVETTDIQTAESREPSLYGTWERSGVEDETIQWFIRYTFDEDGTFLKEGYPPIYESGNYRIVSEKEGFYDLEWFLMQDETTVRHTGHFEISQNGLELLYEGQTFTFVSAE